MNAFRYAALLLLLVGPLTAASSQTRDGGTVGDPIGSSAFADAEVAYDAEDFRRSILLYTAALGDYGRESNQHASYINYRIGSALMNVGYRIPYGTSDSSGQTTEDYALLAVGKLNEAIRLSGIDASRTLTLFDARTASLDGAPVPDVYNLSRTWRLKRKPVTTPDGYARLTGEWSSADEHFVQMFYVRAEASHALSRPGEVIDNALAAISYAYLLTPDERLQMLYVLGDTYQSSGDMDMACQMYSQALGSLQDATGDWTGMAALQQQTCNHPEDE